MLSDAQREMGERYAYVPEAATRVAISKCNLPERLHDDLRSAADEAFVRALRSWDPSRAWDVRKHLVIQTVRGCVDEARAQLGRGVVSRSVSRAVPLDAPVGDDGLSVADTLRARDADPWRRLYCLETIREHLARCRNDWDREILARRLLGDTLREISLALGVPESRVARVWARARAAAPRRAQPLTSRELDVIVCAAHGLGERESGEELGVTAQTVKTYRKHALAKLGARSMTQAVAIFLVATPEPA
jgi:DNA-binding CsgD family transcriptional regulator